MDREIRVAYMKGRNNYLCRQKLYESESRPMLNNLAEIDDFSMIRAWEKESPAGDRAELRKLPADSSVWAKLDARRELCSGQKCEQFERCFLTLMHQRAAESDIIIVNQHLFFADLALREDDYASIIPDYQAVIFDEAHEMEEVAGQHFGVQISNYRFDELARDIQGIAFRMEFGSARLDKALDALRIHAHAYLALFEGRDGRNGFRDRAGFAQRQEKQYSGLLNTLEGITAASSRSASRRCSRRSPRRTAPSSCSSTSSTPWSAPAPPRARRTPPTCSSRRWPAAICAASAPPRSTSSASTSRRTRRSSAASSR
jgi:ATP-dependent DNA helicase DinG